MFRVAGARVALAAVSMWTIEIERLTTDLGGVHHCAAVRLTFANAMSMTSGIAVRKLTSYTH